jgi:sugar lactone lactonase YvrE
MDRQRLTRAEYDGTVTVLAETFEGQELTGPNDVDVESGGSIWFSDNGRRDDPPQGACRIAVQRLLLDPAKASSRSRSAT